MRTAIEMMLTGVRFVYVSNLLGAVKESHKTGLISSELCKWKLAKKWFRDDQE